MYYWNTNLDNELWVPKSYVKCQHIEQNFDLFKDEETVKQEPNDNQLSGSLVNKCAMQIIISKVDDYS